MICSGAVVLSEVCFQADQGFKSDFGFFQSLLTSHIHQKRLQANASLLSIWDPLQEAADVQELLPVVQTESEPRASITPVCCLPRRMCVWTVCSSRIQHQTTADRVSVDEERIQQQGFVVLPTERSPAGSR